MTFYYNNILDRLVSDYNKTKEQILIISPFVTLDAVKTLISRDARQQTDCERIFITLPPGEEYIEGASHPGALFELKECGFTIYLLERLHAKLYMFDRKILYLGSANLTSRGMDIGAYSNLEILARTEISREEALEIQNQFLNNSIEVDIPAGWDKNITDLLNQLGRIPLQDNYHEILNAIRTSLDINNESKQQLFLKQLFQERIISSFNHIPNGFYRHAYEVNGQTVKVFRSRQGIQDKNTFSYQITNPTAKLIRQRKIKAILFILEEDPDRFVCLPSRFLIDNVLKGEYTKRADDWQIKIKRSDSLWISPHGRNKLINISVYEGKFHTAKLR